MSTRSHATLFNQKKHPAATNLSALLCAAQRTYFLLQFYQKIHGAFYTNVTTVKIEIMYGVYQPVSQFPPSPLFVCMPDEVEADATKVVIGL